MTNLPFLHFARPNVGDQNKIWLSIKTNILSKFDAVKFAENKWARDVRVNHPESTIVNFLSFKSTTLHRSAKDQAANLCGWGHYRDPHQRRLSMLSSTSERQRSIETRGEFEWGTWSRDRTDLSLWRHWFCVCSVKDRWAENNWRLIDRKYVKSSKIDDNSPHETLPTNAKSSTSWWEGWTRHSNPV